MPDTFHSRDTTCEPFLVHTHLHVKSLICEGEAKVFANIQLLESTFYRSSRDSGTSAGSMLEPVTTPSKQYGHHKNTMGAQVSSCWETWNAQKWADNSRWEVSPVLQAVWHGLYSITMGSRAICRMCLVGHFADSSLEACWKYALLWKMVQYHPGHHLSWSLPAPLLSQQWSRSGYSPELFPPGMAVSSVSSTQEGWTCYQLYPAAQPPPAPPPRQCDTAIDHRCFHATDASGLIKGFPAMFHGS